jgi:hypothetical protein
MLGSIPGLDPGTSMMARVAINRGSPYLGVSVMGIMLSLSQRSLKLLRMNCTGNL